MAFLRGARRSPGHKLISSPLLSVAVVPPPQFAFVPPKLNMWGNDQYGDCVSAEEAFAKACYDPEIFIDAATVIAWARKHNYLEGANLTEVMDSMQKDGFVIGKQKYDDGAYYVVDYSDEVTLQGAIAQGPVKIAIDANALSSDAGNKQGWYKVGGTPGQWPNTDHCVALCGYGPTSWLYSQLGMLAPIGLPASGYLLYTWNTIGFVDHKWIMSTCVEAWVRNPTTVGVPPLVPGPGPTVDVKKIVDQMFADLEKHAKRASVRNALITSQALCDQWLSTHGY